MAFEQLLILATIIAAFAMVRLIRRFDLGQRGYLLAVGATVTLGLLALVRGDRFLGVVAIGLSALTVVVPGLLELLARAAFNAGQVRAAVAIAGLRALLMPGAGLGRQQEILRGLALLEHRGVDAALDHFHDLADDTEDGGELAIIHEQIVAMLFYGLRWTEGIAHYEGRFHPGYAAVRPALALGLLRAYGESQRMDTAAGLLRALEEGPIGSDPRAVVMLSQARVTFLAYAGEQDTVTTALREEHLGTLGMSPANGALLRGIAAARAGDAAAARAELSRVPDLAAGPSDNRAVEASSAALDGLPAMEEELPPEVREYVGVVAGRLRRFIVGTPSLQRHGALVATPMLIASQALGYLAVVLVAGGSGIALLDLGAVTPELWNAGARGRVATAPFIHGDAIGLVLAAYALWLGGPVIERLRGSLQLGIVALVSGMVGAAASVAVMAPPASVVAAGNFLGFGVAFGALTMLLPPLSAGLARSSRRTLAIPLALVLVACILASVPAFLALDVLPVGLAAAAAAAVVTILVLPRHTGGWRRGVLLGLLGFLLLGVGAAGAQVAREDVSGFLAQHRERVHVIEGVELRAPSHVGPVDAGAFPSARVPVYAGLADWLSARMGVLAQIVVVPNADPGRAALPQLDEALLHEASLVDQEEVPEPFASLAPDARHQVLRRNGQPVALVFERRVGNHALLLLLAPPPADDEGAALLATIWAEGQVSE